jgi:hypothetical protein
MAFGKQQCHFEGRKKVGKQFFRQKVVGFWKRKQM